MVENRCGRSFQPSSRLSFYFPSFVCVCFPTCSPSVARFETKQSACSKELQRDVVTNLCPLQFRGQNRMKSLERQFTEWDSAKYACDAQMRKTAITGLAVRIMESGTSTIYTAQNNLSYGQTKNKQRKQIDSPFLLGKAECAKSIEFKRVGRCVHSTTTQ